MDASHPTCPDRTGLFFDGQLQQTDRTDDARQHAQARRAVARDVVPDMLHETVISADKWPGQMRVPSLRILHALIPIIGIVIELLCHARGSRSGGHNRSLDSGPEIDSAPEPKACPKQASRIVE